MARVAGIAYVKVNGSQQPLRGSFTVSPSSTERTGIAGQDYVHGYMEVPRVPYIAGDITLTPGVLIDDLDAMVDETVTAELANGKVYVLSNAWTKSAHELNAHDGQVAVRWEGLACTEISS
jgi:hypothetical protein